MTFKKEILSVMTKKAWQE